MRQDRTKDGALKNEEQPTKALLVPRCVACDSSVLHIIGHRRGCALAVLVS